MDQRNLGQHFVGKTEEEEAGRCRRALECELVYDAWRAAVRLQSSLQWSLLSGDFGGSGV